MLTTRGMWPASDVDIFRPATVDRRSGIVDVMRIMRPLDEPGCLLVLAGARTTDESRDTVRRASQTAGLLSSVRGDEFYRCMSQVTVFIWLVAFYGRSREIEIWPR